MFTHYQTHHPRCLVLDDKTARAISARLLEGFSVADLCLAIDGMHRTPHNLGENDRGTKYLDLELCMRSGANVNRFMEKRSRRRPGRPRGKPPKSKRLCAVSKPSKPAR